jgi:hypothetical protein
MTRFLPSVPGYVYAQNGNDLYVNLFMSNSSNLQLASGKVNIAQTTAYPWNGKVDMEINPAKTGAFTLRVRVPGWTQKEPVAGDLYSTDQNKLPVIISVNGKSLQYPVEKGYAVINRTWKKGDKVAIDLPMQAQHIFANSSVKADAGRFAIQYGPVVYCLEGVDNKDSVVQNIVVDTAAPMQVTYAANLLNGINVITTNGEATKRQLNTDELLTTKQIVTAIPYYAWDNRGPGEMEVWIPYNKEVSRPQPAATIANTSKITASIKTRSLKAINDQIEPADSKDASAPYFHWWPKKNTTEWVAYEFDKPHTVSSSNVYWFDDGPWGGCRIPAAWKIYYKTDDGQWLPVKTTTAYELAKDKHNAVTFEPVTTSALKLEVQLPVDNATGIHEWSVK